MKNVAIIVLAILTILFFIYGFMQSIEAQRQSELAMQGERRALVAENDALRLRDQVETTKKMAVAAMRVSTSKLAVMERELNECRKNQTSKK